MTTMPTDMPCPFAYFASVGPNVSMTSEGVGATISKSQESGSSESQARSGACPETNSVETVQSAFFAISAIFTHAGSTGSASA